MTRADAEDIGANAYAGHPAAAPLILEAVHGATPDRRERSKRALLLLDPAESVPDLGQQTSAWAAATAIAYCLVANVSATPASRRRIAGLLAALCSEAARIREAEAAA